MCVILGDYPCLMYEIINFNFTMSHFVLFHNVIHYCIENFAMGKRGFPNCNWIELRMGKIKNLKLETLDENMRERKLFKGEEDFLPPNFIYPLTF